MSILRYKSVGKERTHRSVESVIVKMGMKQEIVMNRLDVFGQSEFVFPFLPDFGIGSHRDSHEQGESGEGEGGGNGSGTSCHVFGHWRNVLSDPSLLSPPPLRNIPESVNACV